jgi:hypothetical protein
MRFRAVLQGALIFGAFAMLVFGQAVGGRMQDVPKGTKAGPAPRMPDGKPDLGNGSGAWNPRTVANLTGTGRQGPARSPVEKRFEHPFLPWAKAFYDKAQDNLAKDDPESRCLPPGIPRMMATPFPFQIYQLPDRIIQVWEGGAHMWRIIPMDGRPHSKDPDPWYLGEPRGRWEGDTLVVDNIAFKLHVIERYTRVDSLTLRYEYTIDDPGAYSETWSNSFTIPFVPGGELAEYVCQENNEDVYHMVGK